MKKLSKPMEDMIKGAVLHEVRVDGIVVMHGLMVAGRVGTIVALIDRELITTSDAGHYGLNWLTDEGIKVYAELTGESVEAPSYPSLGDDVTPEDHQAAPDMITEMDCYVCGKSADTEILFKNGTRLGLCESVMCREVADDEGMIFIDVIGGHDINERAARIHAETADDYINAREAAIEADNARLAAEWDDVAAGEEHYESMNPETNELPGDAERIFDMENAALEGADIRAEYEAEVAEESRHAAIVDELIAEIYADDRPMFLTSKGSFVSGSYVNTMRRIAGESRNSILAWRSRQYESRLTMDDDFHVLDMMVDEGTISFGRADRYKRVIRATCRPRIGAKRKPSKNRR